MSAHPEHASVGASQTPAPGAGRARFVALALVAVAMVAAVKLLPVNQWLLAFVAWIRDAGTTGMAVFVLAYIVACILLLPGLILTLGAGFAYGVAVGIPLVWVSANLGAAAAFLLGRTLARDRIAARVSGNPKFAAIDRAVGREGLKIVLLTRLSPAFPFNLLNYAYGLTRVTFRDYAVGSLVGMVPGTAMYVYLRIAHHQCDAARLRRAGGQHGEAAAHLARLRGDGRGDGGDHPHRAARARRGDRQRGARARAAPVSASRRGGAGPARRRAQPGAAGSRAPERAHQSDPQRAIQPGRRRGGHRRPGLCRRRRRPRRQGGARGEPSHGRRLPQHGLRAVEGADQRGPRGRERAPCGRPRCPRRLRRRRFCGRHGAHAAAAGSPRTHRGSRALHHDGRGRHLGAARFTARRPSSSTAARSVHPRHRGHRRAPPRRPFPALEGPATSPTRPSSGSPICHAASSSSVGAHRLRARADLRSFGSTSP